MTKQITFLDEIKYFFKKNIRPLIFFIAFIIKIIIIIKLRKRYKYKIIYEPILIKKPMRIKPFIVRNKRLMESNKGHNFAYSFWIFMDSVSSAGNWKHNNYDDRTIFKRGDSPILKYNPAKNLFTLGILTKTDIDERQEVFTINQINLQKWTHVVISVDNRTIDIFVDGELKDSFTTKNVPIFNKRALIIGSMKHKIHGKICNFRYFNTNIDPLKVDIMYKYGKDKAVPTPSTLWWLLT